MLGWMVVVRRAGDGAAMDQEPALARWETGAGGLRWLDALAGSGLAKALGGNGYPLLFRVRADAFSRAISGGLPTNDGPEVIGDDYVLPAGYNGALHLDAERLGRCPADEWLAVEAWDLS